jgi:hypothetical protein
LTINLTTPFQAIREIAPDSHLYRKYGKEAPTSRKIYIGFITALHRRAPCGDREVTPADYLLRWWANPA